VQSAAIDDESLEGVLYRLQMGQGFFRKVRNSERKEGPRARTICLEIAEGLHRRTWRMVRKAVYGPLRTPLSQSSALVECINSIIRP